MIIKLSNADFSANNIGKINILNDISEDTKLLLRNFTRTLSNDERYAVDNFISSLKLHGVWESISNLYMPILAGDLSECGLNIKTLSQDFTPSASYYQISAENGIEAIAGGTDVPEDGRMTIFFNGSQMNHHWAWMPMRAYDADKAEGLGYFKTSNAQRRMLATNAEKGWQTRVSGTNNGNSIFSVSVYPCYKNLYRDTALINLSFGTDAITSYGWLISGNEEQIVNTSYNPSDLDDTYTDEKTFLLNSNGYGIYNAYGLISLGSDLSDEQLIAYYDACRELRSVFLS